MVRFFCVLASVFFISSQALAFNVICAEQQCIGVVDVGSTGSRLHVYAYKKEDKTNVTEEIWVKKVTPGFAMLNPEQSHVDTYLNELFEGAPEAFPVYFYASAGMRLLPTEQQKKYFDAAENWFQRSAWSLKEAKTLTGREEGVFAWLSVHEQLRRMPGAYVPRHLSVMDMGGASVQVVSAVDFKHDCHTEDYVDVYLHGKKQTLFVHSFLGLGHTLVVDQFLDEPTCFSDGYTMPNGGTGHGHAHACARQVSKLIDGVHEVHHKLHPALHPEPSRVWYVIEGLAYLLQEEVFNHRENSITNDGLLEQAESAVCHRPWEQVQQGYPDTKNLSRACLSASYYHALIRAYGIPPREPIHMIPNTPGVDWTLGVALYKR